MTWIRAIAAELFGLFVDDGTFALAILAWLAVCGLALPRVGVGPEAQGVLLFAGLAAVLVESAARRARRG